MLALVAPPQDLHHPPHWGSPKYPLSQSVLGLPRDKQAAFALPCIVFVLISFSSASLAEREPYFSSWLTE